MAFESPQSFIVAEECRKATWQNGFRRDLGEVDGWARFGSTTAKGTIALTASGPEGPWFLAVDHPGVVEELAASKVDMPGPGQARYAFATLGDLYVVLPKVYALSVSLPDAPLDAFQKAVEELPKSTEAERLILQRVGQDIFRKALLDYWEGRCPITNIAEPRLLRASHIKPWAECETDAERLDVHNGLLLSAHLDAAFDAGMITFDDTGRIRFSRCFNQSDRSALGLHDGMSIMGLTDKHRLKLKWHREHFGFSEA